MDPTEQKRATLTGGPNSCYSNYCSSLALSCLSLCTFNIYGFPIRPLNLSGGDKGLKWGAHLFIYLFIFSWMVCWLIAVFVPTEGFCPEIWYQSAGSSEGHSRPLCHQIAMLTVTNTVQEIWQIKCSLLNFKLMTLVTITFNNQVTHFLKLEAYALHTGACSCSESSGQSLTQCWVSKNWGPALKNSRQIISEQSGPEFAFYQTNRIFPTTPMSLSFLRPHP